MKHIAVFCSAYDLEEKYTTPAREFAKKLAQNGYHLVWGGSNVGLMKIIADLDRLQSLGINSFIIAVGDIVVASLIKHKHIPNISIFDFKTKNYR